MIRLGVIGMGERVSWVINQEMRAVAPDLKVVGVVDPDEAGARSRLPEPDSAEAIFYETLDEMVRSAKPDALVIGTRCNLHTPYAIQAARCDLPLFLEKPVSNSMEQAISLEKAFENSRCTVVVSFPLRVSPLCVMARTLLEEGAVGHPNHVMAFNYVPYGTIYFDSFYRIYPVTQGLFLQKATHDFDYLSYLMGERIVRVGAMASLGQVFGGSKPSGLVCSQCDEELICAESPRNRLVNGSGRAGSDHPCVFGEDIGTPETGMNEDSSSALLEFAGGAHGVYTQVFYSRRDAGARGATISGYEGTLTFDWYQNHIKRIRHHQPFSDTIRAGGTGSHMGGDSELARDFIGVIRGTRVSRTPIESGIQSAYTCLAAKESAETGQFVTVRQVGG
ncbi:MAG: Gfo/Idh/MocA family oxidoreductase [Armatimonadetes bacterium]|nr:Gfo/Idh/MocA family oxidoreductase [Armatimonadota bacterium]